MDYNIPDKANRVLNIILLGLLLILIRVWFLAVIQHDEHVERARKPQRRTAIKHIERATIRDRFNIPLALNKIQYSAAICYADLRSIPSARYERDAQGKRIRVQARVEYIKKLSQLLGKELGMDPQKIEDIIHGKASLFPHTPFVIKEDLTEKEYYRLKLLEKEWIGIQTEKGSKRYYPKAHVASDVIGFIGAISSQEYHNIAQELSLLQTYLAEREAGNTPILPKGFYNPFQVRERVKQLQEKAYTINDSVGKTGVEATFDPELRGYTGRKVYEVDIKGNVMRELPGSRKAIPGQRLLLSLSSELQEFAEQLLIQHEKEREAVNQNGDPTLGAPWIKGGAIVAMDPKTGEVLALASYPRVDLNDFIPSKMHHEQNKKRSNLNKWLENESYVGEIWDGKRPMERDRFDESKEQFYEETLPLTLEKYYEAILSPDCAAEKAMHKIATINVALFLQQEAEKLLELSGQSDMSAALNGDSPAKQNLDYYLGNIPQVQDKILVLDLCRMLVNKDNFTPDLNRKIGHLTLSHYRSLCQAAIQIQDSIYPLVKEWYHNTDFQEWRQNHFKEYLKQKRAEEKQKKRYTRPYTEYLDAKEKEMFQEFWKKARWILTHHVIMPSAGTPARADLLPYFERLKKIGEMNKSELEATLCTLAPEDQLSLLMTMRSFAELDRPLLGHYRSVRNTKKIQLEKHLAGAFYPLTGFGFARSQAFRQSTPQGSVFKIVVAYQALLERYQLLQEKNHEISQLNPLTLIDDLKWHPKANSNEQILGYTLDGKAITRQYKGGKLPRSSHSNIGKIDITSAIEQSSNIYFSILAAEHIQDPLHLLQAARLFGFGEKTGIELPGEFAGSLPSDISHNRTGLYSFSIGQHSLIVTPLQTAVMMSAIANQGHVLKPTIVQIIAGQEPLRECNNPFNNAVSYPFQDTLDLVGIHFPLFTSTQTELGHSQVWYSQAEIKHSINLPTAVRTPLIDAMKRVITGSKGTARPEIIRLLHRNPEWKRDYYDLKNSLFGKTGTAEFLYKQTLDVEIPAKIHNHIWFAGVATALPEQKHQELTVVVYLRFSESGGKEAAPLAVEVVKKWREICAKHGKSAYVEEKALP